MSAALVPQRAVRTLAWLAALGLAGCATGRSDLKLLDQTLEQYASSMRWGDVAQTLEFHDPTVKREAPAPLELERWRQVQVAAYRQRGFEALTEDTVRATAEVEVVNRHTQQQRSFVDVQEWRYDAEQKRWWLTSGLPRLPSAR